MLFLLDHERALFFIETMLQWALSWQDGGDYGPRSLLYMQACDYLSVSDYVYISLY